MAFWNVPPLFYVASKVFVKSCCFVSPLWRCLCGLWFLAYPVLPGSSTQWALGSFEDPLALCPVHFAADPGSYPFPRASFCISEGWRIKTGLKINSFCTFYLPLAGRRWRLVVGGLGGCLRVPLLALSFCAGFDFISLMPPPSTNDPQSLSLSSFILSSKYTIPIFTSWQYTNVYTVTVTNKINIDIHVFTNTHTGFHTIPAPCPEHMLSHSHTLRSKHAFTDTQTHSYTPLYIGF